MQTYCSSNVDIIRHCCLEFRAQFMEVAVVDLFRYVTIALTCMATYRSGHIQPDTIAMVPVHSYTNRTNFSPDTILWLDFVAFSQDLRIRHALNETGARKIAGFSIDGFCPQTKTVYQYQGYFFHGYSACYDGNIQHPLMATSNILPQSSV